MPMDVGLFGPDSVAWRVHRDPSLLIGGMRSVLIQALHPVAMAAVVEHSGAIADPWGRIRRTAEYVQITTYGDTATAEQYGAVVRAVHDRVAGVDPLSGRAYTGNDTDLLLWIHNVEVHSFLTAYRHFSGRLTDAEADSYVSEMVKAAALVGLDPADVPYDMASLRAALRSVHLVATPGTWDGLGIVLAPPMPLALRPLWALPVMAAISVLPRRARAAYGFPYFPPGDAALRVPVSALVRAAKVLLPSSPVVREAMARAAG